MIVNDLDIYICIFRCNLVSRSLCISLNPTSRIDASYSICSGGLRLVSYGALSPPPQTHLAGNIWVFSLDPVWLGLLRRGEVIKVRTNRGTLHIPYKNIRQPSITFPTSVLLRVVTCTHEFNTLTPQHLLANDCFRSCNSYSVRSYAYICAWAGGYECPLGP